jgi:DNA-binding XRE family transcriptional regulator
MNEQLKKIREQNFNTLNEIAELLEISPKEYQQKEEGKMSLTNYERKTLAEYYGVNKETV